MADVRDIWRFKTNELLRMVNNTCPAAASLPDGDADLARSRTFSRQGFLHVVDQSQPARFIRRTCSDCSSGPQRLQKQQVVGDLPETCSGRFSKRSTLPARGPVSGNPARPFSWLFPTLPKSIRRRLSLEASSASAGSSSDAAKTAPAELDSASSSEEMDRSSFKVFPDLVSVLTAKYLFLLADCSKCGDAALPRKVSLEAAVKVVACAERPEASYTYSKLACSAVAHNLLEVEVGRDFLVQEMCRRPGMAEFQLVVGGVRWVQAGQVRVESVGATQKRLLYLQGDEAAGKPPLPPQLPQIPPSSSSSPRSRKQAKRADDGGSTAVAIAFAAVGTNNSMDFENGYKVPNRQDASLSLVPRKLAQVAAPAKAPRSLSAGTRCKHASVPGGVLLEVQAPPVSGFATVASGSSQCSSSYTTMQPRSYSLGCSRRLAEAAESQRPGGVEEQIPFAQDHHRPVLCRHGSLNEAKNGGGARPKSRQEILANYCNIVVPAGKEPRAFSNQAYCVSGAGGHQDSNGMDTLDIGFSPTILSLRSPKKAAEGPPFSSDLDQDRGRKTPDPGSNESSTSERNFPQRKCGPQGVEPEDARQKTEGTSGSSTGPQGTPPTKNGKQIWTLFKDLPSLRRQGQSKKSKSRKAPTSCPSP